MIRFPVPQMFENKRSLRANRSLESDSRFIKDLDGLYLFVNFLKWTLIFGNAQHFEDHF